MTDGAVSPRSIAHLSIHDVAPHTLDEVEELLRRLAGWGHDRAMLLVIPGLPWSGEDLDRLRGWVERGHRLAGHGWVHRVERYGDWRHALHGLFFSRRVAEHLALDRRGVKDLVSRCADWFDRNGFEVPTHYVPPAWALGPLTRQDLRSLPFHTFESLRGTYDAAHDHFVPGPLVGFEADTRLRAAACRVFNLWNLRRSSCAGALRISLHPFDLRLRLADDLERVCRRFSTSADPSVLLGGASA